VRRSREDGARPRAVAGAGVMRKSMVAKERRGEVEGQECGRAGGGLGSKCGHVEERLWSGVDVSWFGFLGVENDYF